MANDRQTIENAGINALDNAARGGRIDAAANNIPLIVYTIGLGNAPGGVNNALLERIANDPSSATHQAAYTTGLYMYSPDTAHLSSAFATIASDIRPEFPNNAAAASAVGKIALLARAARKAVDSEP